MDAFLDFLGFYRSDVAKDGSCLFRAVSEQLFYTQIHHIKLRQSCIDYISRNSLKFEPLLNEDLEGHLEKIKEPTEWAGELEMKALSLKYRIDFVTYHDFNKPPEKLSTDSSIQTVSLVCSDSNRYDCVYTKSDLCALAFCQSVVYEVLYKSVFNLGSDVDMAVEKMLHDKAYSKQRRNNLLSQLFKENCRIDNSNEDQNLQEDDQTVKDSHLEIRKALAQGIPPFPYKVAKTLDPGIYRNVEFDLWNELKKEDQKVEQFIIPKLEPGVKCKVNFNKETFIGHVQEVYEDNNSVLVYIEELCKRCVISTDIMEIIPVPAYKALTWQGGKTYKVHSESPKAGQAEKFRNKRYNRKNYQNYSGQSSSNSQFRGNTPVRSNSFSTSSEYSSFNHSNRSPQKTSRRRGASSNTPTYTMPNTSPQHVAMSGPLPHQICSSQNFPHMWPGIDRVLSTSPIPIPGNVPNAEHCRNIGSPESLNELQTSAWIEEMLAPATLPQGYPITAYPAPQHVTVTQLYSSDTGYSTSNSPAVSSGGGIVTSATSSPLPIPNSRNFSEQQSDECGATSPVQQATMAFYPYPMYSGMYLVCRDGSALPVSVAPWRSQDGVSGENVIGIPSVYINTPPTGISSPIPQWMPSTVPSYGTAWTSTTGAVAFSPPPPPLVGDMNTYQPIMTPPWSPPPGMILASPMAYPVVSSPSQSGNASSQLN